MLVLGVVDVCVTDTVWLVTGLILSLDVHSTCCFFVSSCGATTPVIADDLLYADKANAQYPRRGHSGTEGGRTCVTYFAEEGVFF